MSKPSQIAIGGRIGSGKTTIAQGLVKFHRFTKFASADVLKDELSELLNVSRSRFSEPGRKEDWRRLMQEWGRARRSVSGSDYWVNKMLDRVDDFRMDGSFRGIPPAVVVDDMRYANEPVALQKAGFVLVHLNCPKQESIEYMCESGMFRARAVEAANDPSEQELEDMCADGILPPHICIDASRTRTIESLLSAVESRVGLDITDRPVYLPQQGWAIRLEEVA